VGLKFKTDEKKRWNEKAEAKLNSLNYTVYVNVWAQQVTATERQNELKRGAVKEKQAY